ncbi:TonB-dependent receptor [Pelobium manganitolerans]|uniref:TonB-dependent receptor n=1 Tax=Pelobium manganitolerans TaxID=1842495 RepID=UPI003FA393D6
MIFSKRKTLFANVFWRKLLMTMKLTAILICTCLINVYAGVYGQKKFSINASDVTVKEMLKKIEKESDFSIFYRPDQINLKKKISVQTEDGGISDLLAQILVGQPLNYELSNNTIVIKPEAADYTINGKVVDEKGLALPGATVSIKGGSQSTLTNENGEFSLRISGNAPVTLVVTYLGFDTQEVSATMSDTNLTISLVSASSTLNEVVVIGYGTVKKRDLTGSVSSVKAEEIALNPVSNPIEAIQGRVAGLDIQRSSGSAGSSSSVLLRGNRSITASGEPLYIIDGFPGSINTLNPNDIETIDVLKDASSTAIYGASGANGVIIITTKKAKEGKAQITANSYYGINGFSEYPKPLMGDAWVRYLKDKYYATNGVEPNSLLDLNLPLAVTQAIDANQYVDWVDETLQTGQQQNHHVSISGGSEKVKGYLSLGYINEKGIYPNDEVDIFNNRAGVDVTFNKIVSAGVQSTVNWRNRDQTNSRINKSFGIYPVGTVYNPDGTINLFPIGDATVSPLANYAPGVFVDNSKNLNLAVNPYLQLNPIKNLSIRSNLGITLSNSRQGTFQNERSYNMASESRNTKAASYDTGIGYNYLWENILNYKFTLNKDHSFDLTGITSMAKNQRETSSLYGEGLDYDEFLYYNLGAAPNITGKSTRYEATERLSFAGRVNYSYKGKYLLTASLRSDGVSQLVKKWSSFPSVAAAWRISEENFMADTRDWLNSLKLRASYGVAGSANIGAYQTATEVASKDGTNMSLGGANPVPIYVLKSSLGNPDLTWEKSYTTDVGLDISVLDNRLELSADYYSTETKGVLYARKLPYTSGGFDAKTAYTKVSNIADTENKGFELTASSRNIVNKNFTWNTNLTFSTGKEKLNSIDLGGNVSATDLISEGLFIGYPTRSIYGYKKLGVWQLGEETEAAKYGAKPGDLKLATVEKFDANGVSDGGVHPYSAADRMVLGHENPSWSLGLQNAFTYKSFDLTVFAVMRYGQTIDADILGYYNTVTQPAFYNYWTPTNPTNDYPQPLTGTGINTTYKAALNIVDGSYFKIKNITLGYRLPTDFSKKAGFSNFRIYATAYNPFIVAKSHLLKEVDPETGGTDSFPLYKQLVFGINLSF